MCRNSAHKAPDLNHSQSLSNSKIYYSFPFWQREIVPSTVGGASCPAQRMKWPCRLANWTSQHYSHIMQRVNKKQEMNREMPYCSVIRILTLIQSPPHSPDKSVVNLHAQHDFDCSRWHSKFPCGYRFLTCTCPEVSQFVLQPGFPQCPDCSTT